MKVHGPSRAEPIALRELGSLRRPDPSENQHSGERVEVSSQARALSELRKPEAPDMERVQRLKNAIHEGRFTIDSERIAAAMMREERS